MRASLLTSPSTAAPARDGRRRVRNLAVVLPFATVLALAGCGGSDTATGGGTATETAATATDNGAPTNGTATETGTGAETGTDGSYTMAQVQEHNSSSSCWTVINGDVYDVTDWIGQHPGGPARIEGLCGTDGTNQFEGQHRGNSGPEQELASMKIGTLDG